MSSDERQENILLVRRVIGSSYARAISASNATPSARGFSARRQTHARCVAPGYSYLNSNDMRVHFGLGVATMVERILIESPDGESEAFAGVAVDQIISLQKGQGERLIAGTY